MDLTEDLALSDTSSESLDGVSEDERWMVVDEFFDSFVTVEEKEEAAAEPEADSPSQQPSAPPARPSSPVPGPSGWTPSSAPAKVSSVHIPATGQVPTRPRNPAPPPKTPLMKAVRRIA